MMNFRIFYGLLLSGVLFFSTSAACAQQSDAQHEKCPHASATSGVSQHDHATNRGEKVMGFSQVSTTHHFLLKPDGGVIAVSANDAKDSGTRDQIRMHLTHIARAFSAGDFDIPMFVHDQVPPGVPVMKRLSNKIRYDFQETDRGGEVVLSSTSSEAVAAIHDFLTFQIREHKTGDPVQLSNPK